MRTKCGDVTKISTGKARRFANVAHGVDGLYARVPDRADHTNRVRRLIQRGKSRRGLTGPWMRTTPMIILQRISTATSHMGARLYAAMLTIVIVASFVGGWWRIYGRPLSVKSSRRTVILHHPGASSSGGKPITRFCSTAHCALAADPGEARRSRSRLSVGAEACEDPRPPSTRSRDAGEGRSTPR